MFSSVLFVVKIGFSLQDKSNYLCICAIGENTDIIFFPAPLIVAITVPFPLVDGILFN